MIHRVHRTVVVVVLLAAVALSASPVAAVQEESGTKLCPSNQTGKTQVKFNDFGTARGPGATSGSFWGYYDGLWHIKQVWGRDGGGSWDASGDPFLNYTDTYAFCTQL